MKRYPALLGAVVLLLMIAWTYRHAVSNGFHYDGLRSINQRAPATPSEVTWDSFLDPERGSTLGSRPLPRITFAFDWRRGGGSARAFQLTNIAIHMVVALLVLALCRLVLRHYRGDLGFAASGGALFAALWWALHPIQLMSVTYIVQRMTSLATLFIVAAVYCYLQGRLGTRRPIWLALALGAFWLGLQSKSIAWITPALLLMAELAVVRYRQALIQKRADWLWFIVPVAATLYVAWRVPWSTLLTNYSLFDFTMAERLWTQPRVFWFHLSQLAWPLPERFSIVHDFPVSTSLTAPWTTALALVALVVLCVVGLRLLLRREQRILGFWILWIPATLVIESSVIPLDMVFEHRMYLASVGVAGLVALGLDGLARKQARWSSTAALLVVVTVAVFLSWSTSTRSRVWRDDLTLWTAVVERYPCSSVGNNNLGEAHWRAEAKEQAFEHYRVAVECDPDNVDAVLNLGRAHRDAGRLQEALDLYVSAVAIAPLEPAAHFSLGMLFLQVGDFDQAAKAAS